MASRDTRQKLIAAFAHPGHGSPMESLFWAGLRIAADFYGKPVDGHYEMQAKIGPHRVDFLFDIAGEKKLVVEIDGHEWHEKTKEQAAKDKARDRYLVESGFRVIRFAGSEVWANPIESGRAVLRILAGGSNG